MKTSESLLHDERVVGIIKMNRGENKWQRLRKRLAPDDRAFLIGLAKTLLNETQRRRDIHGQRNFCFCILKQAACVRRRIMALPQTLRQAGLFPDESTRS